MKQLAILFIVILLYSFTIIPSNENSKLLNQELMAVSDSISQLISKYHYNPKELTTKEYLTLEKKVIGLAKTAQTKEEFIKGFNKFWKDGPFSHVRLAKMQIPAENMPEFIDNMKVGDQSVLLNWVGQTAILTVTTMTGLDTKERVFEAYREIEKNNAHSLIIDLRSNAGGTFAGIPLVSHVLTHPIDVGMFVSRKWWENNKEVPNIDDLQNLKPWEGWSLKTFWHDVQEQPLTRIKFKPMSPHYNGPVYILISNKTASAAEFAVDAFAHEENVIIIGETTAGEMLSQKMFDLPHGLQLSLPIAEYYSNRIGKIEGKGVNPNIVVNHSVAAEIALSLINGDELKEALSKANKKLEKMNK